MTDPDEALLRRAEEALAEISRTQGLPDHPAEVLAALRIRLFGENKTLDDAMKAAGELKPKGLEEVEVRKNKKSLDDAIKRKRKKKDWPE